MEGAQLAAVESPRTATAEDADLRQLLETRRYRAAVALYYEAVQREPGRMGELRPVVDGYLQRCLENCDGDSFLGLVDAWLETFYDDVKFLLTLADYQERQGQPEAAANTLLLARTYALTPADQRAVTKALAQLSLRTESRLSEQQSWIELLGYFEFLASIDFTLREFELRRALLYRRLGEQARGDALLASLQAADDGSDPRWTAALAQNLAEPRTETVPGADLSEAIPLERRGDSYVVEVELNDNTTLKLLVDTGASLTSLTRDSFRQLYRPDFSLLGTRLFNTANGYTRGDVYRAVSLTLGQERLEGVDLAVLELSTMDDIDGLLGMNVLRQFRFEIDQANAAMHLSRR